jgi:hypothetical protein
LRNRKREMLLQGRNIILLAGGKAIAAAKSCDLEISADSIPVASPSDGAWEDAIPGRKSWKASCSHLVTGIVDSAAMVGTVVTLRMQVRGEIGLPFRDKVSDVTVEVGGDDVEPMAIVWNTTTKQFLAFRRTTRPAAVHYFDVWSGSSAYTSAAEGTLFYMNGNNNNNIFKKTATDLIPEALQGTAIVRNWKVVGTLGNLAQGSFQFQGKGALSNPTT